MNDKLKNIDIKKIINHWKVTSFEDYNTMIDLYNSKTYHWTLFMGHISTEKLLKAYYVKIKKKHAPPIHNLYRLAEISEIELTDEYADWLDTITSFNVNARYNDFKREFIKRCTQEYTDLWMGRIKLLKEWISQKL